MFKSTPVLLKSIRRLPLSTKQAKKDYYKGNKVGRMGKIDQFGRFKVDWDQVRTYVYPKEGLKGDPFLSEKLENELRQERLQDYVQEKFPDYDLQARGYEPTKPQYDLLHPDKKKSVGEDFLTKWRSEKVGIQAK
ncbi:hypothetical protein K504DRAFT_413069 [Pleomassaria siparia CBS 279.74]|uniref:50S ribosomal protein-like protein YmL27 n=1 Tax=Pleomassaria siparia CBS 279.74 TaxID=1314801 RepID=A0A6G1K086_9PLEO|nr:hypothetical protein K504DRAFT_413069 [Pleomassaria siparia CBS 279.74]